MAEPEIGLYRRCTPVVDAHYESTGTKTPITAVVEALATATGTDATDLSSLYETIDTDVLVEFFSDPHRATDANAVLSFQMDTWNIFVRADGAIRVCDATQPTEPAPIFEGEPA